MEMLMETLHAASLSDFIHIGIKYEVTILRILATIMFVCGMVVFLILLKFPATYGRYSSTTRFYSIAVPARTAWFIQEVPSVLVPSMFLLFTYNGYLEPVYQPIQLAVLSMFLIHYTQRSFIYPFLIKGGKPTPMYAFLMAFVFCTGNGFMQVRGAAILSQYDLNDGLTIARVVLGSIIFFYGMYINVSSDSILRNLRKPGEVGYKIPKGGYFEYVSCANFFGEILEWTGFAVASWSSVSFAFAFFTASNLLPRALFHHRWYQEKFEDYPKNRKAAIPYII